jgi:hypothetical protein
VLSCDVSASSKCCIVDRQNPQCVPAFLFGRFTDILVVYSYSRRSFVDTVNYVASIGVVEIRSGNGMVSLIPEVISITFGKRLPIII